MAKTHLILDDSGEGYIVTGDDDFAEKERVAYAKRNNIRASRRELTDEEKKKGPSNCQNHEGFKRVAKIKCNCGEC